MSDIHAIKRTERIPLYYQLKELLRQQIRSGQLPVDEAIPSEPELVSRYQVSREVVRHAVTELVYEGLLYRRHGCGTFVRERNQVMENERNEPLRLTSNVVELKPGRKYLLVFTGDTLSQPQIQDLLEAMRDEGISTIGIALQRSEELRVIEVD